MASKNATTDAEIEHLQKKPVSPFVRTWQVSYPIIANNFAQILLGIADTIMLSRLSTTALAGVALAVSTYTVLTMLITGWATATQTLTARRLGAKEPEQIGPIVDVSLVFTISTACIITILVACFSSSLLQLFGTGAELTDAAALYLRIRILSLPLVAMTGTLRAFYGGLGATRISMYMALVVNLIHIPVSYLFIFLFHWGVAGAAFGSLISTAVGTCYMIWYGFTRYRATYPFFQHFHLKITTVRKLAPMIWHISWPEIVMLFLVYFTDLLIVGFVATEGTIEIAGIRTLGNIENLMFTLIFACSIGESILMSQSLGAGDLTKARSYLRSSLFLTGLVAGIIAFLLLLFPRVILTIFTPDQNVIQIATPALYVLVCNLPLMVLTMAFSGALRAAGYTRPVMNATLIASYLFYAPLAWIFLNVFHLGLVGVYLSLFIYWVVRLAYTGYRFAQGHWKTRKI
ncbi:MAG TPA: MATE family efflux transporter [Ktedonobacteraceae bacterium]|nr:MATE family efflux transporter [Ktedonobacteraceae bacterium]